MCSGWLRPSRKYQRILLMSGKSEKDETLKRHWYQTRIIVHIITGEMLRVWSRSNTMFLQLKRQKHVRHMLKCKAGDAVRVWLLSVKDMMKYLTFHTMNNRHINILYSKVICICFWCGKWEICPITRLMGAVYELSAVAMRWWVSKRSFSSSVKTRISKTRLKPKVRLSGTSTE